MKRLPPGRIQIRSGRTTGPTLDPDQAAAINAITAAIRSGIADSDVLRPVLVGEHFLAADDRPATAVQEDDHVADVQRQVGLERHQHLPEVLVVYETRIAPDPPVPDVHRDHAGERTANGGA